MKTCPYCGEEILEAAIKCRYCGSMLERGAWAVEWLRVSEDRMVAGVCAGLAVHFGVSVTALRLAFVVLAVFGFPMGFLAYGVLWVIMPVAPARLAGADESTEILDGARRRRR